MSTPGTNRPYNLVDILNSISGTTSNLASQNNSGGSVVGIGIVSEADEIVTPVIDAAVLTVATAPTWNNGAWGCVAWS